VVLSSSSVVLVGRAYQNFVNSLASQESRQQYVYVLRKYMEFLGVNDVDDLIKQDPKVIEQQIIDYIISLQGLSRATKSLRMAAVVSLYSINDVTLNRKRLSKFLGPKQRLLKDRPYTIEEISKMLNVSDERMKVIVLILASTGMRLGGLSGLKLGNIHKIEEFHLYRITVYEGSSEEYICFCSPEAATAIDFYLGLRTRCGEKLGPESPLIRKEFDRLDPMAVSYAKPILTKSYDSLLQEMLEVAGVTKIEPSLEGKRQYRKQVARTTGFRKLVNTTMVRSKVDPLIKEMLLGHHTGLEENYYRPEEQDLLNEYIKCVDCLTINAENRLRREVEHYKVKASQFDSLRAEIDQLKEMIKG
jgi:integrase